MKNKRTIKIILFILFFAGWLYTAVLQFEIVNKGERFDPFRCSDAKKYFEKLGVEVDCEKIDKEVNNKF